MNEDWPKVKCVEKYSYHSSANEHHEVNGECKNLRGNPEEDHEHESVAEFYHCKVGVKLFHHLIRLLSNASNNFRDNGCEQ